MKVISPMIDYFHLDPAYALLSIQNLMTAMQVFHLLDLHGSKFLNDVIFGYYMKQTTDLESGEIGVVFRLLDVDGSGTMEFDEFYLLFCVMIACKLPMVPAVSGRISRNPDQYEKEFVYRHSSSIFRLIDADNSGQISSHEFANMGMLFNFDKRSVMSIFNEFDISGDKNLDFSEFRLFTMACIDEQRIFDAQKKVSAFREYNHRLVCSLSPQLKRYVKTRHLPPPVEIEAAVESTRPPFMIRYHYRGNFISNAFYKLSNWLLKPLQYLLGCLIKSSKSKSRAETEQPDAAKSKCCCNHSKCYKRKVSDLSSLKELDNESSNPCSDISINSKVNVPKVTFSVKHFDH
ncbi:unnamed protein product [Allacma fusca]|uniref:EF-hand domain-containing protein n=1 Tax=Allacma fusca TaxID=39272 RepID=A0A8J2LT95_9HEXA|nr:unnamed protein product [Allacma fusca]